MPSSKNPWFPSLILLSGSLAGWPPVGAQRIWPDMEPGGRSMQLRAYYDATATVSDFSPPGREAHARKGALRA